MKWIIKRLDKWADSLTQKQFNTRMSFMLLGLAVILILIQQTMEFNTIMELQGRD